MQPENALCCTKSVKKKKRIIIKFSFLLKMQCRLFGIEFGAEFGLVVYQKYKTKNSNKNKTIQSSECVWWNL